jgi:hypothetical protein
LLKKALEGNDIKGKFIIGVIIGLLCFFIQAQFELPIEIWLQLIGIIAIIYMVAIAFKPILAKTSFAFVGFLIGVMISLFLWTVLSS